MLCPIFLQILPFIFLYNFCSNSISPLSSSSSFSPSSPASSSIPFFSLHCLLLVLFRFTRRWLRITGKRNYRWFLRSFNSIQRLYILCPVVVPSLPFTWRMTKTSTRKRRCYIRFFSFLSFMVPEDTMSCKLWLLTLTFFPMNLSFHIQGDSFMSMKHPQAIFNLYPWWLLTDKTDTRSREDHVPKGYMSRVGGWMNCCCFFLLKHKSNCPALITRRSNQTHGLTSII